MSARQLIITGPTASGKTGLAIAVAAKIGGQIISADSRQVYQGGDLASGKDIADYGNIRYHLISSVPMGTEYSVFDYQRQAIKIRDQLLDAGITPIVCGGTLFYIEAYLGQYLMLPVPVDSVLRARCSTLSLDEIVSELKSYGGATHNTTDTLDRGRAIRALEIAIASSRDEPESLSQPDTIVAVLDPDLGLLRRNIGARLEQRLNDGLVNEIDALLRSGVSQQRLELMGLEYRYITRHLLGELGYDEMKAVLTQQIVRYAKQQRKSIRRLERKGWALVRQHPKESRDEFADRLATLVR